MAEAGDLHWERVRAGRYRTIFWANGYRYKVEKDPVWANTWFAYYMWDRSTEKQWKKLPTSRFGSSYTTLRHAKSKCYAHNLQPRVKYKFVGRLLTGYKGSIKYGFLQFKEIDRKTGDVNRYANSKYIDPRQIGGTL